MQGYSVFNQQMQLEAFDNNKKITLDDYEQFKQYFTWDALQGLDYGQSFCKHFRLNDLYLLYAINNINQADDHIKRFYLN